MQIFDPKPYIPAAIAAVLCVVLWVQNNGLSKQVGKLEREIEGLNSANQALAASNLELRRSLSAQNKAVEDLRQTSVTEQAEASARAEAVLETLPTKIRKDLAAGTAPKEMNKWFESLFSSP